MGGNDAGKPADPSRRASVRRFLHLVPGSGPEGWEPTSTPPPPLLQRLLDVRGFRNPKEENPEGPIAKRGQFEATPRSAGERRLWKLSPMRREVWPHKVPGRVQHRRPN